MGRTRIRSQDFCQPVQCPLTSSLCSPLVQFQWTFKFHLERERSVGMGWEWICPYNSLDKSTPSSVLLTYLIETFNTGLWIHMYLLFCRYWKNKHLSPKRLSTGILMYTLASAICEEIHLYGFWPFGFDPNTREDLPYHYYDKKGTKFTTKWQESHQLPAEFQLLYRMHGEGLTKLTLSHCA